MQVLEEAADEAQALGQQSFRLVEELQSFGINVSDIKKLQDAGIVTIGSILQTCTRDLITIKGLSEAKIEKVCRD
jgi:predicted RecB family nuclease